MNPHTFLSLSYLHVTSYYLQYRYSKLAKNREKNVKRSRKCSRKWNYKKIYIYNWN